MNNLGDIKINSGNDQIVFSDIFNIYDNDLIIKSLGTEGWVFEFKFIKDTNRAESKIDVRGDDENKKSLIEVLNFTNPLGIVTANPVPVFKFNDGRTLYFSLYSRGLNETSNFLQVSLTFYLKDNA